MNVGDTLPALTTMGRTRNRRKQSSARLDALRSLSGLDTALLHNMLISFRELCYRHTWIKPAILVTIVFAGYMISDPNSILHAYLAAMISVSYRIPSSDQYGKGLKDFMFVAFYALFFTFFREFLMCCVLRPFAHYSGFSKEGRVRRVMEQFYALIYYGILGPLGVYIMYHSPIWYFDSVAFYENYPHTTHNLLFKVYYLGQAAFWVQQSVVLVLGLEKPRKDFKELVLHHIITIALIWCSYRFHFTRVGLAVFITMDVSDFFLALSKLSNYYNFRITGVILVVFIAVWVYLRHYINLKILWSILTTFRTVGPYVLDWENQLYKCWVSQPIVFALLAVLQLVNAYWLFLIIRILYRYLASDALRDERSDEEDDESSDEPPQDPDAKDR